MDIVQIFKKFGPLSENSSPPLVSQAGYGPVCTSNMVLQWTLQKLASPAQFSMLARFCWRSYVCVTKHFSAVR